MSEIHFNTLQDALQHANDRIDVALARTIQLEAITDAHHALLSAVAATHPDPVALPHSFRCPGVRWRGSSRASACA